jgi:hypothetical protein
VKNLYKEKFKTMGKEDWLAPHEHKKNMTQKQGM